MSSTQFLTNMVIEGAQVPGQEDYRMGDVVPAQRAFISDAQDISDSITDSVSKRRRFGGDQFMGPLRNALPDQLVRGLTVTNTGFSTSDGQTDSPVTAPIFVKAFSEGWEQDYVEGFPLFCSAEEPENLLKQGVHSVLSLQVLNYFNELGEVIKARNSLVNRNDVADRLENLTEYYSYMMAKSGQDFASKFNLLGPMTTFKDADIHSSDPAVRRAGGGERMLGFCIFNRARIFNVFSPTISKGDAMYFVTKMVDVSHLNHFYDPRGRAVAARSALNARSLQTVGFSRNDSAFPVHSSSADVLDGFESFTGPNHNDLDYEQKVVQLYDDHNYEMIYNPDTDTLEKRYLEGDVVGRLAEMTEVVYTQYMEGNAKKVGYARAFEGQRPTIDGIKQAHRSHDRMKMLQTVTIYNI